MKLFFAKVTKKTGEGTGEATVPESKIVVFLNVSTVFVCIGK